MGTALFLILLTLCFILWGIGTLIDLLTEILEELRK